MKNPRTLFSTLKNPRLREDEKARMVERIRAHQAEHPGEQFVSAGRVRSPFYTFSFSRGMPLVASFVALFLVGGTVVQAAEGALPGDLLYPIKIGVIEEARVALSRNDESRVSLEATRVERRLEEAQKLAVRETLTPERKERLEKNFDAHAERVEEHLSKIAERDPVLASELATTFEASLSAHDAILASLNTAPTEPLRERIALRLAKVTETRRLARASATGEGNTPPSVATFKTAAVSDSETELEDTVSFSQTFEASLASEVSEPENARPLKNEVTKTPPVSPEQQYAAERMALRAEEIFKRTKALYESAVQTLSEQEQTRARTHLESIEAELQNAHTLRNEGWYVASFNAYEAVLLRARILGVFLVNDTSQSTPPVRERVFEIIQPINQNPETLPDELLKSEGTSDDTNEREVF